MIATTSTVLPGQIKFRKVQRNPHLFDLLPTHPSIALKPLGVARHLRLMYPYEGLMILGYGDWTGNTGPVTVSAFDIATKEPVTLLDPVPSEALQTLRVIDGHAYLPMTDPTGPNNGGFVTNRSGEWENVLMADGQMCHVFDVIKINGSIFVCGSWKGDENHTVDTGVVYQEQPDGSWVKMLDAMEAAGVAGGTLRFYGFSVMPDGQIKVQTSGEDNSQTDRRAFITSNGVNWTPTDVDWDLPRYGNRDLYPEAPAGVIFPPEHGAISRIQIVDGHVWYSVWDQIYISQDTFNL